MHNSDTSGLNPPLVWYQKRVQINLGECEKFGAKLGTYGKLIEEFYVSLDRHLKYQKNSLKHKSQNISLKSSY